MRTAPSSEPPFPADDPDRRAIWTMLVERDIDAFLNQNWASIESDFVSDGFFGIDARGGGDADQWRPRFDTLTAYRDEWLRQAAETVASADLDRACDALHQATDLSRIDINGNLAIAQKKFDGFMPMRDGSAAPLNWRTQYFCRRVSGTWQIAGFIGYMAYGGRRAPAFRAAATDQHVTAGPYTPVVETAAGARLFVISGQAPVDRNGDVIGATIEEQSRATLDNCRDQLAAAGASLADVFKVTVYLTDLGHWHRFNAVYQDDMRPPYPARTAIEAGLLPGFLVEIEMWAVKP